MYQQLYFNTQQLFWGPPRPPEALGVMVQSPTTSAFPEPNQEISI